MSGRLARDAQLAVAITVSMSLFTLAWFVRPSFGQTHAPGALDLSKAQQAPPQVPSVPPKWRSAALSPQLSTAAKSYLVRPLDTLHSIAASVYGRMDLWPVIYYANRNKISNPDLLLTGERLTIPAQTAAVRELTAASQAASRALALAAPPPAAASPAPVTGTGTGTGAPPAAGSGCGLSGTLSFGQLESLWTCGGGPSWAESAAASVAECESGGNQYAQNPSGASGYWQINGQVVPGDIFNPLVNAENAVAKFTASGDTWAQWSCQPAVVTASVKTARLLSKSWVPRHRRLYRDPLRKIHHLTAERVDMGVDYGGYGPLTALGYGVITDVWCCGWPGGGAFVVEKLLSGRLRNRYWYWAEDVKPKVWVGEKVHTWTWVGWLFEGSCGLETGWATSGNDGETMAAALGEWDGQYSTRYGYKASWLLHHLGAPAGKPM